jgi:phosphoribosylamine--glycine ligase
VKVLVIGGGGREHAIVWKVSGSPLVKNIYCCPGNGGTAKENKCVNKDFSGIEEIIEFAKKEKINLTIVGPEAPLVAGIVDRFKEEGLRIFGPSEYAAQLEGSKAFAKEFMKKYGVKTAEYKVFDSKVNALEYLDKCTYPVVIKADGLAAGKGVVICSCFEEAKKTIKDFMIKNVLRGAGERIVIEEYLEGVEASILSITDGRTIIPFISSKDHKKIFDEDKGPNTGGMGVIAPNTFFDKKAEVEFLKDILEPTLKGIIEEGMDYTGIIFFGVMINKKGTYLLEYNVRMGDPETQAVLPLMRSDFVELLMAALDKKLYEYKIDWREGSSCCVVAASKGYPEECETGYEIKGIEECKDKVFIAGAKDEGLVLRTAGGRVLSVIAIGNTLDMAVQNAYKDIEKIHFEGIYYRKDIGKMVKC